ncbi:MAG: DUF5723 family protein [Prevotellaceae bacterium]|jgi:hypothetical protein|nr:DUF5723 family protein [Prevotellaceae bacterium]
MKFCQIKKAAAIAAWMLMLPPRYAAQAQHNATMYFMRDLPAVNMINPAFQPEAGSIYVGIPLISSVYLDGGATLSGINLSNILSSKFHLTSAAKNPAASEGVYANADVNLINVGILVRDMYFTLDITEKTRAEVAIPADVIKLAWYGNARYTGQTIPLSGLGAHACSYAEVALGFSKNIVRDRITVGGKVKRLLGVTFIDAGLKADAFFRTNLDWSTTMSGSSEFSIAGIPATMPDDICTYKFAGKGWGMDVGFDIKADRFIVSGSVLNVGAIRWSGVKRKSGSIDRTFRAENLLDELEKGKEKIEDIMDDVGGFIDEDDAGATVSTEEVLSWTPSTAAVSVAYPLNRHLAAGALAGIAIGRYNSYPLLALSLNTWKYPINGSLSYSYGHSHNLGLGLLFGRRDAQLHVICDNLFAASYQTAQKINLRFGLNLLLGAPKQTGERRKTWSPLNSIDHPDNPYKDPENPQPKPRPLNPLLPPAAQPASKQPLNPL